MIASNADYKRRRLPPALDLSPYLGELGDPVVDTCHMLVPQLSNPRKRQCSEQRPPQLNGTSRPLSKKQKLSYSTSGSQPPAASWDNLSKIWLTKRALRELYRRNAQSVPRSPRRGFHGPLTRHALTELKKNCWPIQPASEFLCECTAECLKDIKRLARHGGPDLLDLRSYPEPINPLHYMMNSSQSSSQGRKRSAGSSKPITTTTVTTTTTKKTRVYDRNFEQNLVDGGVYPEEYEHPDGRVISPPDIWEEINQRLTQPRSSLSPSKFSDGDFRAFKRVNAHAFKESQVRDSVVPIIEGQFKRDKTVAGDVPLGNLGSLTDGTLAPGNPDLFYGARPEQLSRRIRNELSDRIVPSTQEDLPMAPNFFLEVKGPDGSLVVAGRQACYDGALGARGIQSLQSYGEPEPVYDNNAYTVTSIYHGGQLKMYTSHPTQPTGPEDRPEYYMNQLNTWGMTGNPETFRQGATAFRNARDWTKERRDEFIDAANGRMPEPQSFDSSGYGEASVSTAGPVLIDSDTSADELASEEACSFSKRPRVERSESNRSRRGKGRRFKSG